MPHRTHDVLLAQGAGLLSTWKSSDGIIIDNTAPVCVEYRVIDGTHRLLSQEYQLDRDTVVAQWRSAFFDLESRVSYFTILLKDANTKAVLKPATRVGRSTTLRFDGLSLDHKQTVRSYITAYNNAGISRTCVTPGVTVDLTAPLPTHSAAGVVWDGNSQSLGYEGVDMEYSRSSRVAHAAWTTFRDDESGVHNYWVWAEDEAGTQLTAKYWVHPTLREWTMSVPQRDDGATFRVAVAAVNVAGSNTTFRSDGILVDTSPPFFTSGVEFEVDPDAVGLEPNIIARTDATLRVRVSAAELEGTMAKCTYAMGTYPDGSDVTGVNVLRVEDMDPSERTDVTISVGGDNICDDEGVCSTMPISSETRTKSLTLDRAVNPDASLVNNLNFYAWVACTSTYVQCHACSCAW